MIEDMTVRHFKEKVQKDYIRHGENFTVFLGRSPDAATSEDIRLFQPHIQLHMTRNQVGAASVNCAIVALRFFFKATFERADLVQRPTFVRKPRKAPIVLSQIVLSQIVLSQEEVAQNRGHFKQPFNENAETSVAGAARSVTER